MKKKIFSVLFALVLLLSFTLVTAVPVAAVAADAIPEATFYENAGGTAEWSQEEVDTVAGDYSVELTLTDATDSYAQAKIFLPAGTTLADLAGMSYTYFVDTLGSDPVNVGGIDVKGVGTQFEDVYQAPHLSIQFSVSDVAGGIVQHEVAVLTGDVWATDTIEATEMWHGTFGDGNLTFAAFLAKYGGELVPSVYLNLSKNGVPEAADPVAALSYVDTITIGEVVYDLEPRVINTTQTTGFNTIQAAIDVAEAGDTITVAAGTYVEDLRIGINAAFDTKVEQTGLEIVGAEGAVIKGIFTTPVTQFPEGLYNILVWADGIKIHGFTIESPNAVDNGWSSGVVLCGTDIEIYDNAFRTTTTDFSEACVGIQTNHKETWDRAANMQEARTEVNVSGLSIHDNTFTSFGEGSLGYEGIYINLDIGTGSATISDNTFDGSVARAIHTERPNTIITNNTIETNVVGAWQGVGVAEWEEAAQDAVTITGNTITGFGQGIRVGYLAQPLTNITITDNTITGNDTGVLVRSSADGVTINYNNIVGNTTYGVENIDTTDLDATSNWWGSASGPTHASNTYIVPAGTPQGDDVSDLVDFVPWLDASGGESFAPVALDGDADYSSIQAAIDAATSSNITCAAGTYTENVNVATTDLTLLGANAGVCAGVNPGTRGDESVIDGGIELEADNITVDGFQINGGNIVLGENEPPNAIEIGTADSSGHNICNNVFPGPGEADPTGRGIVFDATVPSPNTTVACNYFSGWRFAVYLNSSNDVLFQYNVFNDNMVGIGGTSVSDVTINNNDFTNNGLQAMAKSNSAAIVLDNWFSPCTNVMIHFNNFCGNVMGINYICMQTPLPGEGVDATNNYWCSASGPSHSPGEGDEVSDGVLYNPWLLGPVVPGEPLPTIFEKTLALKIGWTLVSVDNWIDPASAVGADVTLAYSYIPGGGYTEVTPAALVPVDALYLKTDIGGGVGFDYSGGVPVASTKDLVVGWNLISSATYWNAQDILSPLRYIDVGDEQGVGLATLVSQGYFNQHTPSFYLSAVMPLDWGRLGYTTLNPFDGYWVYMNGPKSFGVIPGAQPPPN